MKNNPYHVVKSRYMTEKAKMLEELKNNQSNPSIKKCESPKYVFLVDKRANKQEIAAAIEEIYGESKIRVTKVNTVTVKPKVRNVRGRSGLKSGFKKAVVTLQPGNSIEEIK